MSVMVLQGRKSYPQKSRPPESGHRRHGVWIAIEYSYKLGQKKEFKFLCVTGWFSQIRSQISYENHEYTVMGWPSLLNMTVFFIFYMVPKLNYHNDT